MNINAKLEEKTSKEGKKYFVVVLKLTDTYEKLVFLERPELELIKITNKNNNLNK